jgi:hypothetical protein
VTRGDIHDYLGMTIDYSTEGKVVIRMDDYVENMLAELPENMAGDATTPAAEHLFKVNEDAEALDSGDSELFHSVTAKLLFFAVHRDMRSHTGGTMSSGKGSVYSTSVRQKLVTKSSTEAELVGVDDVMPMISRSGPDISIFATSSWPTEFNPSD